MRHRQSAPKCAWPFQNQVDELKAVINTHTGMMGYFAKFWRGFYPLLLVELQQQEDSINEVFATR